MASIASPERMVTKSGTVRYRIRPSYGGRRIGCKTFDTKEEATRWAVEQVALAKSPSMTVGGRTVRDALRRYAQDVSPTKKGERWEVVRLQKFETESIADKMLDHVEREDLEAISDRQADAGLSAWTSNRELNLWSSVFKHARRWKWTRNNPFKDLVRRKNPKARNRRVADDEIAAISHECGVDGDPIKIRGKVGETGAMWLLAIESGMRLGEMCGMQIDQVLLDQRTVKLSETKNGDDRDVPLTRRAEQILRAAIGNRSRGAVFRVGSREASTLFRKARRAVDIHDMTFHDSRHEAATRIARKLAHRGNAGALDLCRIMGWRDPKQAMTYFNPSAQELAEILD